MYEQLDVLYGVGARNFVLMNIAPLNFAPMYALPENGGSIDSHYWLNEDQYTSNVYEPDFPVSPPKWRLFLSFFSGLTSYKSALFEFTCDYELTKTLTPIEHSSARRCANTLR